MDEKVVEMSTVTIDSHSGSLVGRAQRTVFWEHLGVIYMYVCVYMYMYTHIYSYKCVKF